MSVQDIKKQIDYYENYLSEYKTKKYQSNIVIENITNIIGVFKRILETKYGE